MTPLAFHQPLFLDDLPTPAPHDHVRLPDERVGEVIGFYRNDEDLVLVRLEDGARERYARADVRLLIG